MVHGQSGSRATLFVEPLEVLEQNNRLAELRMEEREEVERILRELTALLAQEVDAVGERSGPLPRSTRSMPAPASASTWAGRCRRSLRKERVRLLRARHPLLVWKQKMTGGRDVTPNDIELCTG